jgi:transposase
MATRDRVGHQVVIEGVEFDEDTEVIVVSCRLRRGAARRCGRCNRRCGRYDQGEGRRRWRALDAGTMRVFIEAEAPRVGCPEHGGRWRRCRGHGAGHTRAFDDQVARLVTHCSKSAVVELMRIAWRSVAAIAGRVVAEARAASDPFDGLVRIGIDEISYRRGHKYLMVVVDHDSGRLVWAATGHERATLQQFFDLLGAERASRIKLISAERRSGSVTAPPPPVRTPRRAWTRFTSSAGSPRTSTSCVARRGTCSVTSTLPVTPASSRSATTRCRRTPKNSPPARPASSPGSPATTTSSTGATC